MTTKLLRIASLALFATSSFARASGAQEHDAVASEALFQDGNRLFEAGNYTEACPKFAESYRLDAGTGTLLKLALCHERDGKLASAWTELTEAYGRAQRENDPERARYARERVQALEPRLSSLSIEVPPDVAGLAGLELSRDGVVLGSSSWNIRIPIDGGQHQIQVTAPGKQPFVTSLRIAMEAEPARVTVPALRDAAVLEPIPAAAPTPPESSAPVAATAPFGIEPTGPVEHEASRPWSTLEWAGVASAGAGLVALGVGGYFLADALSKNGAEPGAEAQGNRATVCGVLGGALVAAGATLFIVGRSDSSQGDANTRIGVTFTASPSDWAAVVRGRF
jgi:hypothetical protein